MKDLTHYTLLSELFRYPSDELKTYLEKWRAIVSNYNPELILKLESFAVHINEKPKSFQQEYCVFLTLDTCCMEKITSGEFLW
jgi:nitrate reductase assembly molybdenum cofactor insertion protein NarJ